MRTGKRFRATFAHAGLCALLFLCAHMAGCAAHKGPRPLADVSAYCSPLPSGFVGKPLCVEFEFRTYVNGEVARGKKAKESERLRKALIETLKKPGFAGVTDRYPAADPCRMLLVTLKRDIKVDSAGEWGCILTLGFLPFTREMRYELTAELREDDGTLVHSYSFADSHRVTYELFLIFWAPFNSNYTRIVTDNLYKQLAIDLQQDLLQPVAK